MKIDYFKYQQYVTMKMSLFQSELAKQALANNKELSDFVSNNSFSPEEFNKKTDEEKIKLMEEVQRLNKGKEQEFPEQTLLQSLSISEAEVRQFMYE